MPQSDALLIGNAFSIKRFAKGSYFAEEGKTSKHLAFIKTGLFQYFYLKDGKETTTYVTGANTFLATLASFYKQQPSKEYVRALIDSELLIISYENLAGLKKESEAFKDFYIQAIESVLVGIDESRSNLIILTAEERYETLLTQEPQLLQEIPLQYLASMLGITPRHLSRIRSNIC